VAEAIAAFKIVVNGGLIPHAKHGGSGVETFTVVVLKFGGIGLENEHIEQIQVAFAALTGAVPECEGGYPGGEDLVACATIGLTPVPRFVPGPVFGGFG
jgi:hypothetical protein